MAIKYGDLNVDEKYSKILEPNLFAESTLVPGVTYTDQYEEGPAGQIYVHKLATSAVEPGAPGRDFTDEATADALIPIALNNNYQRSKKIYGVQESAVEFPLAEENLALAVAEVKEGRESSALACLVQEATADAATTEITDPVEALLATRKAIVDKKGKPTVVKCSSAFFSLLLSKVGDKFAPIANDRVLATGAIGTYLGMTFIEEPLLSATSAKYIDSANTTKTVSFAKVDYIMYNHKALSVIDNLEAMRIKDSENFVGSKAQVEMNTGFKVTNPQLAVVRKHV